MPRLSTSCRDCIQLGSTIQLADRYLMEEYNVLRFYGSELQPQKLPMHVTQSMFVVEYVLQLESIDRLLDGQSKKSIFPSLPFLIGGLTFERKTLKVENFQFYLECYWKYDPLNIIQKMLVANKNSTNLFQHESKPFLQKLKNKDRWDDVT